MINFFLEGFAHKSNKTILSVVVADYCLEGSTYESANTSNF